MAASMKMDELLVQWLTSDSMYENVLNLIEENKLAAQKQQQQQQQQAQKQQLHLQHILNDGEDPDGASNDKAASMNDDCNSNESPRCVIPKFYLVDPLRPRRRRRLLPMPQSDTWMPLPEGEQQPANTSAPSRCLADNSLLGRHNVLSLSGDDAPTDAPLPMVCVRDQVKSVFDEIGQWDANDKNYVKKFIPVAEFVRVTKDIFHFPSFFSLPLCQRILQLWRAHKRMPPFTLDEPSPDEPITYEMVAWYWSQEMEPYDPHERFFRLCKQPHADYIVRDDFLPFIKALLSDHPVSTVPCLVHLLGSLCTVYNCS
jgi:EF-hand domain